MSNVTEIVQEDFDAVPEIRVTSNVGEHSGWTHGKVRDGLAWPYQGVVVLAHCLV